MNRRKFMKVSVLASPVFLLAGCDPFISHRSFNCRITVETTMTAGSVAGSSVIQIIAEEGAIAIGESGVQAGVGLAGQAIVIERANGPLFVLLSKPTGYDSIAGEIVDALAPIPNVDKYSYYSRAKQLSAAADSGLKVELPSFQWPKMVRFRNLNDPKSIELVDSASSGIKHIWLEPTASPLSTGIEKRFPPWFVEYYKADFYFDGVRQHGNSNTPWPLSGQLGPGSFATNISIGEKQ
jgi:hypothetical protein